MDLVVPKAEGLTGLVKAMQRLMGTAEILNGQVKADRQESTLEQPKNDPV